MALKSFFTSRGGKIVLLLMLILLFLVPAGMIRALIFERTNRASEAEREIMKSWGGDFTMYGLVLHIPCQNREEIRTVNQNRGETIEIKETDFFLNVTPEEFLADINIVTTEKKRGIFSVPLFTGEINLKGKFSPEMIKAQLSENQKAFPEKTELLIILENTHGLQSVKNAAWNGQSMDFEPGSSGFSLWGGTGIHSAVSVDMNTENTFDIDLVIQGGKSFFMVPMGKTSAFTVKANWPSPSFQGAHLPINHTITENSFEAYWKFSHLNQDIPLVWRDNNHNDFFCNDFGVSFFKAVDHYSMNTRAAKYAILFIIIPFLGFFLFETLLARNIHPVQYLLAGVGNIMFYLLLLSLSEHIVFEGAYFLSALAVVIMTSMYSRSLLGAWKKSWIMGTTMAFLYTFLYFTMQSEDWALLIGSLGAFGITGLVMFLTRKLDWWDSVHEKAQTMTETITGDI